MMESPFFKALWAVERIAHSSGEIRQRLAAVEAHLRDEVIRRRFFETLATAEWIVPLADAGFYRDPPRAEVTAEGRRLFPMWPASQFLARVAEQEPRTVSRVLASIQTDNPFILSDMVNAALPMPPAIGSSLATHIARALDRGAEFYTPNQKALCDLVKQLSQLEDTKQVAYYLGQTYLFPANAVAVATQRREEYHYLKGLKTLVPIMVSLQAEETLRLLSERLVEAIRSKGYHGDDDAVPMSDHSYIWKPVIEQHGGHRPHDLAASLVTRLRQASELAVRDKLLDLERTIKLLRGFKYLVFHRLELHLINVFADRDANLARQRMMEKTLFEDYRFKHEYAMLVGARFDLLGPTEKQTFFGWIDAGPDMSDFEARIRSIGKGEPTNQDREGWKKSWQYRHLWWIRDHLDGKWKKQFDEMRTEHGVPVLADVNVHVSTGWGARTPIEAKELEGLPLAEVLAKVIAWRPTEKDRGEDLAMGLQNTFEGYVKANPESCSGDAKLMMGTPAMFVTPFVSAMCDGLNEGKAIELQPVLELCDWVVQQPREQNTLRIPTQEHELIDRNWEWCRNCVGDLVGKCCDKKVLCTQEMRHTLWSILEPLTHAPDKSYIVDQGKEDVRTRDFLDHSINNPRGKALHAVFKYARWVADHVKKEQGDAKVVPGGFDAMPQVREALEKGLGSGEHDSFAVRAAYGWHLGLLYSVDRSWLAAHVDHLFDLERVEQDRDKPYGWAAWNAFLMCIPPHIEYFRLLGDQFKYAVKQYQEICLDEIVPNSPPAGLAEHLIILYGRGQLGLDEHDAMLRTFLSGSCQAVRSYAIGFVGQSLRREDDDTKASPLPEEVVDRFVKLWEWYWPNVGSRDQEPSRELFGHWYASGCFDRKWAIKTLAEYVSKVGLPEPEYALPERLAEDANMWPETALDIVKIMVKADREGWRIESWKDQIKQILGCALAEDEDTRACAVQLIDRLGRRGWIEFGEFLKEM